MKLFQGNGIRWYQNGQKQFQWSFLKGKKEGNICEWDRDGNLIVECYCEDDLPVGTLKQWYGKERLKHLAEYEKGHLHGIKEEYYPDGQIASHSEYCEGVLEGFLVEYYENGSLKTEKNFCKGSPVGVHTEYFPLEKRIQPVPYKKTHYVNGLMEGEQLSYNQEGLCVASLNYHKGVLDGEKKVWSDTGELLFKASYSSGFLEGPFFQIESDGSQIIAEYKNNQLNGLYQVY